MPRKTLRVTRSDGMPGTESRAVHCHSSQSVQPAGRSVGSAVPYWAICNG
ncbi:hypothetical protein IW245_005044 [Longispora fulva]|uniref:Uncharacterized protein n=1 Tax=Longispora fulva TaxID=619741 RepID=A0A8J7GJR4_9ACTN|nr:hypothetical protein [Longispora fulva]